MCGIVGLHLRNPDLHPRLGAMLAEMLGEMQDRGADSAGIAVYGNPEWAPPGHGCVSLLELDVLPDEVSSTLGAALGVSVAAQLVDATLVASAPVGAEELLGAARAAYPDALVAGFGSDLTVLKGVGAPRDLTESWGLANASGWQGVGHTRMATESAVTPSGAHPYAVGPEQCLVHNGSFANHATIRRELRAEGVEFDSENDTEVGARFVAHQLAAG
ncbi:glutamine amidotransferase, partial [Gordonia alkanivorans]